MATALVEAPGGFALEFDGLRRLIVDDLGLTAWGERHGLLADGLEPRGFERETGHDEIGLHERLTWHFTTRSVRNPVGLRLVARCYEGEPTALLELVPSVCQPVFGTEEAGSARVAAVGAHEGVLIHQRVNEYGRDATGSWWSQALLLPDPTRGHRWDWGLFAAWRAADGTCVALAPMRAGGAVARLRGEADGLSLVASGGCGRHVYPRLPLGVVSVGATPAEAIARVLTAACKLGEWSFRLRAEKTFPELFETLGYATWPAFGRELTEAAVDEALRSLRDAGLPVRWLCLDEGWQETNAAQQLTGFDAARARFPNGLAAAVNRLRVAGGLRHVGAWLTLQGAWGGVAPDGPLGTRQRERLINAADGSRVPGARPSDQSFWDDWFSHLSTAGLDFVKVDNQGSLRTLFLGQQALDDAADGVLGNLETAADASGLHLVAGMAHHTECLHHFRSTNVARVAADIAPADPRAAKLHIVHAVQVTAWLRQIAWPDFDGFPSRHPAARAFAVAASMLAGPVYLTDAAGQHDADLIRRLCLADGRLLLPADPATVPPGYFFRDPLVDGVPLVLTARAAMLPRRRAEDTVAASRVTPVTFVAALNCGLGGAPLECAVPLAALGLPTAERYAVLTHFAGTWGELPADGALALDLPELGAEVYAIAPLHGRPVALGLPGKLLGANGCAVDDDGLVSLPEPALVLVHDEEQRVAEAIDYLRYTLVEGDRRLDPGEARRRGPWLEVSARSTIFRLSRPT